MCSTSPDTVSTIDQNQFVSPIYKNRVFPCSPSTIVSRCGVVHRLLRHYRYRVLSPPSREPLASPPLTPRSTPHVHHRRAHQCGMCRCEGGLRRSGGCTWRRATRRWLPGQGGGEEEGWIVLGTILCARPGQPASPRSRPKYGTVRQVGPARLV